MVQLLGQDMPGKATEGGDRLDQFRAILVELIQGRVSLVQAVMLVQQRLPREQSTHSANNRVFPFGWEERLVRTQFSRLYNQAVLEHLIAIGETHCFVAHSSDEAPESACSVALAGQTHEVAVLHTRLVESYVRGVFTKTVKIPDHPHCTHVVMPQTAASK